MDESERPLSERPAARPDLSKVEALKAKTAIPFDPAEFDKAREKLTFWGWFTAAGWLTMIVLLFLNSNAQIGPYVVFPLILTFTGLVAGTLSLSGWRQQLKAARNRKASGS